jgi:hypothetical protein
LKITKPKPLNCLLMLSQAQPPPPIMEIKELARLSQECETVYFVTTRTIKGLWPKSSIIAFYADKGLGNAYLGKGIFEDYIPIGDRRADAILRTSPKTEMYRQHGKPGTARGLIELSNVEIAKANETIDDLRGMMRIKKARKQKRLSLANLPDSAAKAQIYFYVADDPEDKGQE